MSRRYEGMDFGKVTVRLGEESDSVIQQYVDDHPGAKKSDAIRCALELFGLFQQYADDIETCMAYLSDIWLDKKERA